MDRFRIKPEIKQLTYKEYISLVDIRLWYLSSWKYISKAQLQRILCIYICKPSRGAISENSSDPFCNSIPKVLLHKYYIVSCSSLTGCRRVHLLDYVRLDPCCKVCYFCVLAEDQKGQIRSNAYNKERPNDLRSNLVYALLCKNALEG